MRKQATTARFLCLDSSFCHTHFLFLSGCSTWREKPLDFDIKFDMKGGNILGISHEAMLLPLEAGFTPSYQVQVEERSRDALDSAHCVFWVLRFLTFHHHVPVEVQLPLDRWVIRLQRQ